MKFINMARQNGKTTMLINAAYVNNAPILVSSESRKSFVKEQAESMGLKVEVYSLHEYIANHMHAYSSELYIDDAEDIIEKALRQVLGAPVRACTISIPYIERKREEKEDGQA